MAGVARIARGALVATLALTVGMLSPGTGDAARGSAPATGAIDTVAGGGVGDGGSALLAPLNDPTGVAVDGSGNLLVADPGNNRVRSISPGGTITTIAGTGAQGFGGDGGPATQAQLDQPTGVATDAAGDVYIADSTNGRVRKVSPDGTITTVAGSGTNGFGGDGGPAVQARLNNPFSVTVAQGQSGPTLYIADTGNGRVRRVAPDGTISTFAGGGSVDGPPGDGGPATQARMLLPAAVAFDSHGDAYIADFGDARLREVGPDGTITTLAGNGSRGTGGDGGPASQAQLNSPWGVAVTEDGKGNVTTYVSDLGGADVRAIAPDGTISKAVGTGVPGSSGDGGPPTQAQLSSPRGISTDQAGDLFIADGGANVVREVSGGKISTRGGNGRPSFFGDGGPATEAALNFPLAVATDSAGDLFIADSNNNQVRKVSTTGVITTVAGSGRRSFGGDGGPAVDASLNRPTAVAVDPAGNLYISDSNNNRVRKVSTDGVMSTLAGDGTAGSAGDGGPATQAELDIPFGLAVDPTGAVLIAELGGGRVRRVAPGGTIATVAGGGPGFGDGGPATQAQLAFPTAVATDAAGNTFVSDAGHNLVREIGADGVIRSVAGNGIGGYSGDGGPARSAQLTSPGALAVDAWGDLFVADTGNNRVRMVATTGVISTLAGNGVAGFSGDGGPGPAAQLSTPSGIALGPGPSLFISDSQNSRIRALGLSGSVPPSARYVSAAYQDFLGVHPPSAADMERAVVGLDSGALTRSAFVGALAASPAWVGKLVDGFYHDTLGRDPDAAGRAYWVAQLTSGHMSVAGVAAFFYASDEYFHALGGGTIQSWVTDLYDKLLHRSPDPAGLAYWSATASSAGRNAVALAMYQSDESAADRIGRLYQQLLGRAPDAGGVAYWTPRILAQGDIALAVNLAASDEYFALAQSRSFP